MARPSAQNRTEFPQELKEKHFDVESEGKVYLLQEDIES